MKQVYLKFPNKFKAVIVNKSSNYSTVTLALTFGAEQESPSIAGSTYIIERLIRSAVIEKINNFGAQVDSDSTHEAMQFTISVKREYLIDVLKILSNYIFDFKPKMEDFEKAKLKLIKTIEKNSASPSSIMQEITNKERYKGTCLSKPITGNIKSVSELTLLGIQQFYYKYLKPENIILTLVGNVGNLVKEEQLTDNQSKPTPNQTNEQQNNDDWSADLAVESKSKIYTTNQQLDEVQDAINQYFYAKTLKLSSTAKVKNCKYLSLQNPIYVHKYKSLNQTRFQISFPSAPYSTDGYMYSKIFQTQLFFTLRAITTKYNDMYGIDVYVSQFKNNAHLNITFAVNQETAEEKFKMVKKVLNDIKLQGVSESEFNMLKNTYYIKVASEHEFNEKLCKRINKWIAYKDKTFSLQSELNVIDNMTTQNYNYVCSHILDFDKMVVVSMGKKMENFNPFS